ncbi:MAG: TonB-dependent receptor, partial [Acidobacteriaceae bacterium]
MKSNPKPLLMELFICAVSSLWLAEIANVPVFAQVAGGTIQGAVTDPQDAVIPKAQISIKNIRTGQSVKSESNGDGLFSVPNLIPGEYEVSASAPAFTSEVAPRVVVTVGGRQSIRFKLKVQSSTQEVTVSTEAPSVETTSSTVGEVVGERAVRELPLNGRSWTDLAILQTGVNSIQTQPSFAAGPDRGNRGFGLQITISGARPQQNNYRLDGVSINDYANGAPGSVLGGNLGVDAIQEFSVLTSNYSAEYGKTSGGVVNAVTRSGGNALHGSAYEFMRNSIFDARNYFDQEQLNALDPDRIPPFKRNQFGGSLGGPFIKSRSFFFVDYEGIRQSKGISSLSFVPSLAARSGSLQNTPNGPAQVAVDPAAQKYLVFFPLPNGGPTSNPDVSQFFFSGQQVVNENFITTRIDHRLSDKDNLNGTYLYDNTPYSSPDAFNTVLLGSKSSRQIVVLEENHVFNPALTNDVRFGFNTETVDNNKSLKALISAAGDLSYGALPGRAAANVLIGGGITQFSGGIGASPTYFYDWKSFQGYDDASANKGNHTLKFGVAFERMLMQEIGLVDPNGIFRFPTLFDFLTNGQLTSFNTGIASSLTPRDFRQNLFGAYLQDDWRLRSNVTINAGLRYETASVPTEIHGKLANLRNITDAQAHLGNPLFSNPTLGDFEPRIGFSWDPLSNGKTAVRGGFGLFDVQPLLYQFTLLENQAAPFFQYSSINSFGPNDHAFYTGVAGLLQPNSLRSSYIPDHPKRDYVMQYNLNVQHEITNGLTAMVAYIGSRGIHQPFRVDDADIVLPTKTSAGYLWPVPGPGVQR